MDFTEVKETQIRNYSFSKRRQELLDSVVDGAVVDGIA
jgi:hypothetical protein